MCFVWWNSSSSYQGCSVYKDLQNQEFPSLREKTKKPLQNDGARNQQGGITKTVNEVREPSEGLNYSSYAEAVKYSNRCEEVSLSETIRQFLNRFGKLLVFRQQSQKMGSRLNFGIKIYKMKFFLLRIAVWNANCLISHRQEVLTFINHNTIYVHLCLKQTSRIKPIYPFYPNILTSSLKYYLFTNKMDVSDELSDGDYNITPGELAETARIVFL